MIRSRRARLTAFLTPYLLGTLLLIVFPASLTFYIAFMRYDGVSSPVFVGWQNFQFLYNEPLFKRAFANSMIFTAWDRGRDCIARPRICQRSSLTRLTRWPGPGS
ncbi:hypothetical protein [Candidatus Villigracilis saccharophilus]|uniref:hypothetical protein n=1 Tax=Candidatus Villigracilis saccharophilus TaxID=3140684 RepID=UPI0031358D1D|nr:sugar ABC transporter permease [Anaerolineales bacterium]